MLLYSGYQKENVSMSSDLINRNNKHLGNCLFYVVTFKYMVSLWECVSYVVAFGAIIQGLTPITILLPHVLMQGDGGAVCLVMVLWHRQSV